MANPARPRSRRVPTKTLLGVAVLALCASTAGVLAARSTLGMFSGSGKGPDNALAAGTVTLTADVTGACTVTSVLPGATPSPCSLTVTYGGSLPAYLGLDVLIETQAGNGGTDLYDPGDPSNSGLQVAISSSGSSTVTHTVPTVATTCPASAPSSSTCYELDDEIVDTDAFNTGDQDTFTTAVRLPADAATGYRGGAAQVILAAHAVQSSDNPVPGGCAAGQPCTGMNWK